VVPLSVLSGKQACGRTPVPLKISLEVCAERTTSLNAAILDNVNMRKELAEL
jgi:hypothetical protein